MATAPQPPNDISTENEANDFIQQLAISCEVLFCVQLLSEFQVLACIPPNDLITYSDVAEIVGRPETQLRAVVRMASSVGFLRTPRPDSMAHTALSARFVKDLEVLDAFGFAAGTLAPCALSMAEASRSNGVPYSVTFGDFTSDVQLRWRLQRQASAHDRLTKGNIEDTDEESHQLLAQLDWASLGDATVVDVGSRSIARAMSLASRNAAVSVVVQSDKSASLEPIPPTLASRIRVEAIDPQGAQSIQGASVYIIQLASPTLTQPARVQLLAAISRQLATHLPILRHNPLTRVVLIARVLPELPGRALQTTNVASVSSESLASYRNLAFYQLTGGRDHERGDVLDCVKHTGDADGTLVVTNEILSSRDAGLTAFEIHYHRLPQGSTSTVPIVPQIL